ncbi:MULTISPECIES: ABC transporter permease [unclassified Streptococcus]|uniref:ABC transporter permease n=1 Tax=unclassified Streptococcus TaxID=2608887 RepID=UPI00359D056D
MEYALSHREALFRLVLEHLQLTLLALGFALVFGIGLTLLLWRFPRLQQVSVYLLSVLYAVPSFAFFALLIPLTGLGQTTTVIVLTLYAQYILVRSFLSGLIEIDSALLEAGRGMGMTEGQLLVAVQLPLAVPALFAGIKLAATSIIAMATIGATINAGGLGTLLFDGLRTASLTKLIWGIGLTVSLSGLFSLLIDFLEDLATPKQSSLSEKEN